MVETPGFGRTLVGLFLPFEEPEKVDIRLPGKGNGNFHDARPVY